MSKQLTRDEAYALLKEYNKEPFHIQHGETVECVMRYFAKELGYEYVVVLGNPKYYNRFGFVTSKEFGIKSPFDVPSKNFMALNLIDNDDREDLNAVVEYPKPFLK